MAYTDKEKANALVILATNNGDYIKTAKDTGVSKRTLIRWAQTAPKKEGTVPELIEAAIKDILENMPEKWTEKGWPIALGILLDKWLLAQGMATSRSEQTVTNLLEAIPEHDRARVIEEAERILARADSRRSS